MYEAKYATDVTIHKHTYTEREWSWRADAHYETVKVEYQVRCLQPVYSESDQLAINTELREEALKQFRDKYAGVFKKHAKNTAQ